MFARVFVTAGSLSIILSKTPYLSSPDILISFFVFKVIFFKRGILLKPSSFFPFVALTVLYFTPVKNVEKMPF